MASTSPARGLMAFGSFSFASGRAVLCSRLTGATSLPRLVCTPGALLPRPSPTPTSCSRFFSSSLPIHKGPPKASKARATNSKSPTNPKAPIPQATKPSTTATASRAKRRPASSPLSGAAAHAAMRSFAEQLGRRTVPTLLYEAPSHLLFRVTTLGAGFLCIGYSLANYWSVYISPPEGLVWWVPHAFGFICVTVVAVGTYFIMGGLGIIRAIHAVPAARLAAIAGPKAAAAAVKAATTKAGPVSHPVFLELQIGHVLPVLSPHKRYVVPSAVVLPFRLATCGLSGDNAPVAAGAAEATPGGGKATEPMSGYERVQAHRAEQERIEKLRAYEREHLMTAPFRHAGQGAQTFWRQMQRAFSRDGFVDVFVDGRKQKMDVSGGWALENGRALDRLVTVKDRDSL